MAATCQHCGQALPEMRLGVRLSPLKARLFDMVKRRGDTGADVDYLQSALLISHSIKSHVWQINDAIEDSGYRIKGYRGFYRLVKRSADARYDAQDDLAKSLDYGYGLIRDRMAAGGPGWEPKT